MVRAHGGWRRDSPASRTWSLLSVRPTLPSLSELFEWHLISQPLITWQALSCPVQFTFYSPCFHGYGLALLLQFEGGERGHGNFHGNKAFTKRVLPVCPLEEYVSSRKTKGYWLFLLSFYVIACNRDTSLNYFEYLYIYMTFGHFNIFRKEIYWGRWQKKKYLLGNGGRNHNKLCSK